MRNLSFPLDLKYAKSNNENYAELRRLRISALIVAVGLLAGGIALFLLGSGVLDLIGIALVIISVATAALWFILPRKVGSIEHQYASSPLVGSLLADKRQHGVTLLGLVNVSRDPDANPRYALVTRTAPPIIGHPSVVGAKIPCAAVLADRTSTPQGDTWDTASLMPISWGTKDKSVIARASGEIQNYEWDLLKRSLPRAEEVRATKNQLVLLATEELPHALRGEQG